MDPIAYILAIIDNWWHPTIRWLHILFAIAWIGPTYLFVRGARNKLPSTAVQGARSETWWVHGGYLHVDYEVEALPSDVRVLNWMMWESMMTMVTGMILLKINYTTAWGHYAQIIGAALIYGLFWWLIKPGSRFEPVGVGLTLIGLTALGHYFCVQYGPLLGLYYLGATIGTAMVLVNVWLIILPINWLMIRDLRLNRPRNEVRAQRAFRGTIHNSYVWMTMLILMTSKHHFIVYAPTQRPYWESVAVIVLIGVLGGHILRRGYIGRTLAWFAEQLDLQP